MLIRKKILLAVVYGIIVGLYIEFGFLDNVDTLSNYSLELLAFQMSGAQGTFMMKTIPNSLMRFNLMVLPNVLFSLYLGKNLYEYFTIGSVYVLSRIQNKRKWFLKENSIVCLQHLFYISVQLATVLACTWFRWNVSCSYRGLKLLIIYWIFNLLWNYIVSVVFDIFALNKGGNYAFVFVLGISIISLFELNLVYSYFSRLGILSDLLININPYSHLVLCWNIPDLDGLLFGEKPFNMNLAWSFAFFIMLAILLTLKQYVTFIKKQVISTDIEKEMI